MKKYIYLHADDFGMNPESSGRMAKCAAQGKLDGISVFPNGCTREAVRCVEELPVKIKVHINLVEGKSLSDKSEVPLLVDEEGYFKYSFLGLFLLMLSPGKKEAVRQVALEIKRQIRQVQELSGLEQVGIDSHQHVHMIPGVFQALCQALEELGLEVDDMRIPAEPVLPFLKHISLYPTYQPVNIVKTLMLNLLYLILKKDIERLGIKRKIFMGIMFSGCMDEKRVLKVLPDFIRIAKRKDASLELLFHPGYLLPREQALDERKKDFLNFYYDGGRKAEESALCSGDFYRKMMFVESGNLDSASLPG